MPTPMMSSSTLTAPMSSKSVQIKFKRGDKNANAALVGVLEKFSIADQVELRRNVRDLPKVLLSTWRETYTCLDFEDVQKQLIGDALHQFLRKMRRHFRSVRFNSDQLQEQLNLLERSGIAEMPGTRECKISSDGSGGDSYTEWPLQSLPKLLSQLNSLDLHVPVQVGFVEQFDQLRVLKLHKDVSDEALAAIWSGCASLQCLHMLSPSRPNIAGISQCTNIVELTLPMAVMAGSGASEVLRLPQLQFLELQQQKDTAEDIIGVISLVMTERAKDIKILKINGRHLGNTQWLSKLELQRCSQLNGLRLIDCQFGSQDVGILGVLPVLSCAAFCQCADLKDNQVLEFVKVCPVLCQLYLVGCPQLTKILYNLFKLRCIENLGAPALGLYLQDGEPLSDDYKQNFGEQSTLELLKTPLEDNQMQHVQFIFHNAESRQ